MFFSGFAPCRAVDRRWRRSHPEPSTRTWCSPAWHRLDGPVAQFSRDMAIAWISLISIHSWVANPIRCFKSYPEIPRAVQKQSWHPKKKTRTGVDTWHNSPAWVRSFPGCCQPPNPQSHLRATHFHSFLYDFNWFYMFNQSISIQAYRNPQKKTSGQISGRHHLNKPCLVCDLSMAVRVAMQPARMQHHIGVCGWLELGGRISLGTWADSCWIPTDLQYIIGPLCHLSIHVMDTFLLLFRSIEIPLSDLLDTLGWLTQTPIFCYLTFQNSKSYFWILEIPCTGL